MNVQERSGEIDQIVVKPAQTASPKLEPRKSGGGAIDPEGGPKPEERREEERAGADPDERCRDIARPPPKKRAQKQIAPGAERRPETADAFARSAHGR